MASKLSSPDGSPLQLGMCQGSLLRNGTSSIVSPESSNQTLLCQSTTRLERLSKDSGVSEHGSETNSRNQEDIGSPTFVDEDDEDDMESSALLKIYGENLTSIHQHVQQPFLLNFEDTEIYIREKSYNSGEMDMNYSNECNNVNSNDDNMGGAGISVFVSDEREINGIKKSECQSENEKSSKYLQSRTQSKLKSPTSAVIPCSCKHSDCDLHQHQQSQQIQKDACTGESSKRWQLKCGTSDYSSLSSCESQRGQDGHDPSNDSPDSSNKTVLSASNIAKSSSMRAGSRNPGGVHVQFKTATENKNQDNQILQCDTFILADGSVELNTNEQSQSQDHLASRLWSKLMPDSSPSEEPYINSLKKKSRHISNSSSLSMGSGTSDSINSEESYVRPAPDGGWGWVVVAASFMVHCIADGVTMSFGVIFVEFLDYFQEGKSLTSWIGSLFMSIPLLAGPLASLLTDRYGCKKVTIIGAIVASFGFFISAFANNIPVLLITVGVITGLGLAVCYVAGIVIVAFYFEKKRSLATGIAVAGSGIGTFVFAPLIQYFIDNFGWRLTLIFLSGIFLNMVVSGMLMRDLKWKKRKKPQSNDANTTAISSGRGSNSHSSETVGGRGTSMGGTIPTINELRQLVKSGDICALLSPDDIPHDSIPNSSSLILLPTYVSQSQQLPSDFLPWLSGSSKVNAYELVSQMYPHLLSRSMSDHLINNESSINQNPNADYQDEEAKNKWNEKHTSKNSNEGCKNRKRLSRGNSESLGSVISPQQATALKNLELALHMAESNHTGITQKQENNKVMGGMGGGDYILDFSSKKKSMLHFFRCYQRHMANRTTSREEAVRQYRQARKFKLRAKNRRIRRQSTAIRFSTQIRNHKVGSSRNSKFLQEKIMDVYSAESKPIWKIFEGAKSMHTSFFAFYIPGGATVHLPLSLGWYNISRENNSTHNLPGKATHVSVPSAESVVLTTGLGTFVGIICISFSSQIVQIHKMVYNCSFILISTQLSFMFFSMTINFHSYTQLMSFFGQFVDDHTLVAVVSEISSFDVHSLVFVVHLLVAVTSNLLRQRLFSLVITITQCLTLYFELNLI
ncbi:unnamed protein product, partial [Meganyctiphanes norvegica]